MAEINIQTKVDLAPLTTFQIGGPAKFFVSVRAATELEAAVAWAAERRENYFILGGGSNILVSDQGFDGLVIKMANDRLEIDGEKITIGAGLNLSRAVMAAMTAGLSGLEWAAGIPGSVGGAVRGNAGAYGGEMKDAVAEVRVFNTAGGQWRAYETVDCRWGYRDSLFKHQGNLLIWEISLQLHGADKDEVSSRSQDINRQRQTKSPLEPSAGCVFQNLYASDLVPALKDKFAAAIKYNKLPAAAVIEALGWKGRSLGQALVSPEHANFIVNAGQARAEEVVGLINQLKTQAKDLGLDLTTEIELVGFN